jgi:predicted GNAT family N-acyltransferase
MDTPQVRRATLDEILALRAAVLRAGRPSETALLPGDDAGRGEHWGAWVGAALVACASLYRAERDGQPSTQLRGAATAEGYRSQGIGGMLLDTAIDAWRQDSTAARPLWCNARIRAVPFYERHGFIVRSDEFEIPNVGPHRVMEYVAEGLGE